MVVRNNPPQFGQPVHLPTNFTDAQTFNPNFVTPERVVYKFFTHASGPTGSDDENVNPDASLTESIFEYRAPADGFGVIVNRLNQSIIGTNPTNTSFGGVAGPLTTGLIYEIVDSDNNQLVNFIPGRNLKKNIDFVLLAGFVIDIIAGVAGNDGVKIEWTTAVGGVPLLIPPGGAFRVKVNDDISGNSEYRIMLQGIFASG